ncbi:hypothetical protein EDC94DRAFT_590308 [Helicostylum pulchrum]|nr:hypothetical protein EDC94DRAFT_590308 [Helicostylum pulchrum]
MPRFRLPRPRNPKNMKPTINILSLYCDACMKTNSYLQHLSAIYFEEKPELYQGVDYKNPSKKDIRFKRYCADCHKVFLQKVLYHIHLHKIHGIKPLNYFPTAVGPDVNNPSNYCTLCEKTFQIKNAYRRHMNYFHNMLVTVRRRIINSYTTSAVDFLKKYCSVCNRVYKTLKSYQNHLSTYHHIKPARTKSLSRRVNRNEILWNLSYEISFGQDMQLWKSSNPVSRHQLLLDDVDKAKIHGITLPRLNRKVPQINRDIIPDMNDKKKKPLCLLP